MDAKKWLNWMQSFRDIIPFIVHRVTESPHIHNFVMPIFNKLPYLLCSERDKAIEIVVTISMDKA